MTRRRPTGDVSEWICDVAECKYGQYWRRASSWSSADSSAKSHNRLTGHQTLVQRVVTRRYEGEAS